MAEITFRAEDHTYWLGNRRVPNVTSVLEAFAEQYAGIAHEILKKAQDRGTAVHLACEYDDLNMLDEDDLDPRLFGYLEAWRRFRKESGFEPDFIEERVFHKRYFYAGTLDRTGSIDKEYLLLDIKSGSALGPMTGPQTAAYAEALRTDRRKKALPRCGVELHKDGTYRFERLKDPDDLPTFLAALKLWNWKERHK